MSQWVAWGWFVACGLGDTERRAPTTVECPDTTTLRVTEAGTPIDTRFGDDTQVMQCVTEAQALVGDQLELHAEGGSVAVEGRWEDGQRHGIWTAWRADGSFVKQSQFERGVATGEWLEVTDDGRVTGVTFDAGVVIGLRSLPIDTEMPEWDQGIATLGRRYQGTGL